MDNQQYKQASRKDVAAKAGVTETIVSYVVNNNRYVSSEKRDRVLRAIKELNYRPNSIARALKGKATNHILFIADHITNEHFGTIVEEMDKVAYNKGYLVSLIANRQDDQFVPQVISRCVDGIVISSTSMSEETIQKFVDANIPVVVLMNRDYSNLDPKVARIYTGLYHGIKESVDFLFKMGRKNLAYIDRVSRRGAFSDMTDLRLKGFCDKLSEENIKFDDSNIFKGFATDEELFVAIRHRVIDGHNFNGIVCRNDNMASIAISAIQSLGLQIPNDVAVIGFDNSIISRVVTPSLTTMEMNRREIGKAIIEMLDDMIKSHNQEIGLVKQFKTKLIVRESADF